MEQLVNRHDISQVIGHVEIRAVSSSLDHDCVCSVCKMLNYDTLFYCEIHVGAFLFI